jgi:Zn-dependent protease with chaperone function
MALIFNFLTSPIIGGIWRPFEQACDAYALEQTGDAAAAVSTFEKLAAVNLSNPDPPAFIRFWFYDHPTLSERVEFAQKYQFSEADRED